MSCQTAVRLQCCSTDQPSPQPIILQVELQPSLCIVRALQIDMQSSRSSVCSDTHPALARSDEATCAAAGLKDDRKPATSWCPDCNRAVPGVEEAAKKAKVHLLKVVVGTKEEYKADDHFLRYCLT